jgi:hypothetical protein
MEPRVKKSLSAVKVVQVHVRLHEYIYRQTRRDDCVLFVSQANILLV